MPLIYVFAASKMEARPIFALSSLRAARPKATAAVVEQGGNRFAVVITGMGTGNAQTKADAALGLALPAGPGGGPPTAEKPDAALVIGLCGGLTRALPEQPLVAYAECLSTETMKPPLPCSSALTNAIVETLQRGGIACERVTGITSTRIATTTSDRLALAKSGATVVDMESYQIVSAAARAGVPAAVLRVISDSLDTRMPDFNPALDAEGGLNGRKALRIALGSPLDTLHLAGASKRAMARLSSAVKLILQSNCFQERGSR